MEKNILCCKIWNVFFRTGIFSCNLKYFTNVFYTKADLSPKHFASHRFFFYINRAAIAKITVTGKQETMKKEQKLLTEMYFVIDHIFYQKLSALALLCPWRLPGAPHRSFSLNLLSLVRWIDSPFAEAVSLLGHFAESTENAFNSAFSKLFLIGHPVLVSIVTTLVD